MIIGVNLKINVTKIDKARLFKGEKGTYLDAVAYIDIDKVGEYGDNGMITQGVTKEQKANGDKGAILGNSKVFWRDDGNSVAKAAQKQAPQAFTDDDDLSDVPW